MIRDVLQSITNVEIFPIISLILFVISFLIVFLKTWMMDKTELTRLSRLPLDDQIYPRASKE